MIKKLATIIIAVVMMITGLAIMANGQQIINTDITTSEDYITVIEVSTIDDPDNDNISFWIQDGAENITILIYGDSFEYNLIGDNVYSCDVSSIDFNKNTVVQLSYTLEKTTSKFQKTLLYNTTTLIIDLDGTDVYSGGKLTVDSFLNIPLQRSIETKTETIETIKEGPQTWYIVIIVILIILVALSFVFPSKKQKTTKKRETASGSEELLSTKKTLLMELLKDIEKKHRAKQISDDTYHKLKDQYKQEAVEAMKKLEDAKSKVK